MTIDINSQFFDAINKYNAFNIVGHIRPDGDCIGSQLALYHVIKSMGKECFIIDNYEFPPNFDKFMDGITRIKPQIINKTLPLICVDCSDFNRVGEEVLSIYRQPFLSIDHHISNNFFGENNIIDVNAASTTEIIAEILMNLSIKINSDTASMLYIGILTDTGRFAYEKTTEKTFKIAQYLVQNGANTFELYKLIFSNNKIERLKLLERFLHNIEVDLANKICISYLSEKDFAETGAEWFDTEDLVDYTRSIADVEIGTYIEFKSEKTKVSLRSENPLYRVDLLAKEFGGGGHPCASGFNLEQKNQDFVQDFKETLIKYMHKKQQDAN